GEERPALLGSIWACRPRVRLEAVDAVLLEHQRHSRVALAGIERETVFVLDGGGYQPAREDLRAMRPVTIFKLGGVLVEFDLRLGRSADASADWLHHGGQPVCGVLRQWRD